MNGIRKGDDVIYITHIDGYKKPVLAIGTKNVIKKIALFDNEECAEEFSVLLNKFFGLQDWQNGMEE